MLLLMGVVAADLGPPDSFESLVSVFEGEERRLDGNRGCGQLREQMLVARMCHESCGKDVACHKECPKPWKPLVEACHQAPLIIACHEKCAGNAACTKTCPTFAVDWIQKKFEAFPERFAMRAQMMCPRLEKSHACHQACLPGDFQCHKQCPRVWQNGKGKWNHDQEVEQKVKPDAKGCYDKGEYGVWCPKDGDWHCIKNCKNKVKQEIKPDARGCYDKGTYGVWCPKGDEWHCVKNCKDEVKKDIMPDAKGCYDKGEYGVWCPKGRGWYCIKNCKDEMKVVKPETSRLSRLDAILTFLYDKVMSYGSDLSDMKVLKEIVV